MFRRKISKRRSIQDFFFFFLVSTTTDRLIILITIILVVVSEFWDSVICVIKKHYTNLNVNTVEDDGDDDGDDCTCVIAASIHQDAPFH